MQMLSARDNGTTVIEFTDAEAHDLIAALPGIDDVYAAHVLRRLLATVHGETTVVPR